MRFLAAYLLKGRAPAVLVTAVMAILALLLPPLSYFSGASVALVTLHLGVRAGLELSLLATLAVTVLMVVLQLPPQLGGVFLLVLWLPVWVLAANLRRTAAPARSIVLALLFGGVLLLGFYLVNDAPTQWWLALLQELLAPMLQQIPEAELPQIEANLLELAARMSGVMAAGMVASLLGCLFLGRWWQAVQFNPGGFGDEFRRLRLGQTLGAAVLSLAALHLLWQLGGGDAVGLLRDLLVLLQVGFALQGVAVAHALVHRKRRHKGWLIAMYVALLLLTGPAVLLLAVAGVLDNWFDFRGKSGYGKQGDIG
ncbi:MAG: DUF2232 domain-containing protein [Gammaproteobacteria bacterium]|nr:DUF2232 domain-containing protein [Gammaproteobacteria bacterium]